MSIGCTLLLTSNSIMGWMGAMSCVQWFQMIGILASIIASCYVAYNQHLNIQWKREQARRNNEYQEHQHQEHDKR